MAESSAKLIQFSIWPSIQLHDSETSIHGFRFNVLYGLNQDVYGFDLGLINRVKGNMKGLHFGLVNLVGGDISGCQFGVANSAQKAKGLQCGLINHSVSMTGIQIGLAYNTTDTLRGLQAGLFNFIWNRKPVSFLPLVNASF
jgi:hypothetical protein